MRDGETATHARTRVGRPGGPGGTTVSETDEAVYRAAWYYYNDHLTQSEISKLLHTSRASVGRLLERARAKGIVKITLDSGTERVYGVGAQLIQRFHLDDAVIVPGSDESGDTREALTQRLTAAGAQYLASRLQPGEALAVGWGNTVSRALLLLGRDALSKVRVVTLTGGVDPYLRALFHDTGEPRLNNRNLTSMIPAPMLASSPQLAKALMDESPIRLALDEARQADHAVVGIGAITDDATVVQLGYQTPKELAKHAHAGIVGDMLGRFFYADGAVADLPLHKRVIGTDLDQLREMRDVIAIAGGVEKAAAITAALRGRYLNVLVTDLPTAHQILALSADDAPSEDVRASSTVS